MNGIGGLRRSSTIGVHAKSSNRKIPVFYAILACRCACRAAQMDGFVGRSTGNSAALPSPASRKIISPTNKHECGNKTTAISI